MAGSARILRSGTVTYSHLQRPDQRSRIAEGGGHDATGREPGARLDPQRRSRSRLGVGHHVDLAAWSGGPRPGQRHHWSPGVGVSVAVTDITGCLGKSLVTELLTGQV